MCVRTEKGSWYDGVQALFHVLWSYSMLYGVIPCFIKREPQVVRMAGGGFPASGEAADLCREWRGGKRILQAGAHDTGFLKETLGLVDEKKPFRGPALYRKGEYLYHCSSCGSLEWFQGQEEIYYGTVKIYECVFHGGAVA